LGVKEYIQQTPGIWSKVVVLAIEYPNHYADLDKPGHTNYDYDAINQLSRVLYGVVAVVDYYSEASQLSEECMEHLSDACKFNSVYKSDTSHMQMGLGVEVMAWCPRLWPVTRTSAPLQLYVVDKVRNQPPDGASAKFIRLACSALKLLW
jgi:hypothetical protein